MEGLNFHTSLLRASGTQYLADHVLALFPNLKALILSYNGLDDPSHRDVIVKILREFPNIDYVMINGNGIADHPEELAALVRDDPVLLQRLESKVVFSPEIIVDTIFSSPGLKEETVWKDTQHRFHRWWESQNSALVSYNKRVI